MRFAVSLVVACFLFTAESAAAQQSMSPPQADQTIAPSHLSAARDTLRAMLLDSGVLSTASLEAFRIVTPQIRSQITATPFFNSLSPERQRAVSTYLENFPPIGQQETMLGASDVIEQFAPQLAQLFSEAELSDISVFMRTPEGQAFFMRSVMDGVNSHDTRLADLSSSELAAFVQFSQTPGGAALNERADQLAPIMRSVGEAATGSARVSNRLLHDLCAILAEQCPAPWRTL
ncbi:MAG: DUF2059 domain-containing protein [Hyphomonadaceae bacterium]|nr:DUF2059 domain-containing protein [Hyphomonadaceae bacterium]